MRPRPQRARLLDKILQFVSIFEAIDKYALEVLRVRHYSCIMRVVSMVEDVASPFLPLAKEIFAIARFQTTLRPILPIFVNHDVIYDLSQQEFAAMYERFGSFDMHRF